jgi:hypothetical protein
MKQYNPVDRKLEVSLQTSIVSLMVSAILVIICCLVSLVLNPSLFAPGAVTFNPITSVGFNSQLVVPIIALLGFIVLPLLPAFIRTKQPITFIRITIYIWCAITAILVYIKIFLLPHSSPLLSVQDNYLTVVISGALIASYLMLTSSILGNRRNRPLLPRKKEATTSDKV